MRARRLASIMIGAAMLAACASTGSDEKSAAQPPDSMAGRWILSEANAPTCGINFGGTTGVQEGPLLPEGGCPEKFFTSKSWTLNQGTLTINDEGGQPLAQLAFADGRFTGQSAAGTAVTLAR
jgi:Protease inhibitor Inh